MGRDEDNPVFVRARISADKRDRLKIACIRAKTTIDSVINELIDKWLEENDPQPKQSPKPSKGKGDKEEL